MGLCTAHYLAREGFAVTIIERNAEGADSCASGSAGYVSPSHLAPISAPGMVWQGLKWMMSSRSPFYIKPRLDPELIRWGWLFARSCTREHTQRAAPVLRDLCLAGRQLFVELAEQTGNAFELRTEGLLNLCKTPEALDHEAHGLARLANELGVEARVLDAKQTAEMEPGARLDVAGSVYFPIDAHLTPSKFIPALVALLKEQSVEFLWNTSVNGWHAEAGRVTGVSTSAGELVADEYVIATGSWAPQAARSLGLRLPMQAGKGYSLTIEQPRFKFTKPLILTERRVAVTPMGDRLRFGGTMELSGHTDYVAHRARRANHRGSAILFSRFPRGRLCGHQAMVRIPAGVARRHALHRAFRAAGESDRGVRPRDAGRYASAHHGSARGGDAHRPQAECGHDAAQSGSLCLK